MPKVIIISDVDLDGYYKLTVEYLDAKYHSHPSEIPDYCMHPSEHDAVHRELNSMASHAAVPSGYTGSIGKLVL